MKHQPPPLQIGTPCPRRWEEMHGNTKRRFCESCQLHVHNLSAMSDRERARFVANSGENCCIAYELRPDGSMVTPSRWSWAIQSWRRTRWVGTAVLATLFPFLFSACATRKGSSHASQLETQCKVQDSSERQIVAGTPLPPERQVGRKKRN